MATKRIRYATSMAGSEMIRAGQEADVDAAEAKRLIDAGLAEEVGSPKPTKSRSKKPETATPKTEPEKAVTRK